MQKTSFILFLLTSCLLLNHCTFVRRLLVLNVPGINDHHFLPNATVKTTNPTDLNVSAHYNEKDLPDSLLQNLKENKTVAFLVLKNDSLVYEWYQNGYSAKKRTNVFSVTKSIMSILVGIALKEGKIKSLDEPVSNYYTEFREGERSKITFKLAIIF